ncbi:hypothetical protein AB0I16_09040 [Streptomyces sp. NPDC050703]|uniref:hypothetical protein n=1 Tax=Streptomyces sp. NPDC050703 TaxID=3157218 RepID=UPI003417E1AD
MQPSPSSCIPPNELRPGRHWYATAVAITVVSVLLGTAIGMHRFKDAIDAVDVRNQFADGDTVTLRLDPEDEKAIWRKDDEFGASSDEACGITGPGDPRLTGPGIDVFLTRDETWNPMYDIEVSRAGDYKVTCTSQGPSRYAIGDRGGLVALGGRLMVAILVPMFGIGIGVVIALVTALRRRGHRGRSLAGRRGSDAPGTAGASRPGAQG